MTDDDAIATIVLSMTEMIARKIGDAGLVSPLRRRRRGSSHMRTHSSVE